MVQKLKKVYGFFYQYYIKAQSKRARGWVLHYSKKLDLQLLLNLDNLLDFLIWEKDVFEPEILRAIENIPDKKEGLFLDVGSQIGQFSLFVRKNYPALQVESFEPYKPAFYQQQANMLLNNISYRLYPKAVSDKTGRTSFYSPSAKYTGIYGKGNPAISGLLKEQLIDAEEQVVEAVTLDDFQPEWEAYKTVIIKIDVEGAEKLVLAGGECFFCSAKNIFLLIELQYESLPDKAKEVHALLENWGFNFCNEKWEKSEASSNKNSNYFYKKRVSP